MNSPPDADLSKTNENSSLTLVKYLLTINKAYKESIDEKLASLRQKLEQNRQKQAELINEISTSQKQSIKSGSHASKSDSNTHASKKNESELIKIKLNYFKDRYGSEPEENADTLRKNQLVIRDCIPQCKTEWTLEWRSKLKEAVLKDSLRVIKLPITTKVAYLEEKLFELMKTQSYSNSDLKVITKQKKVANKLETKIDQYNEDQVFESIDPTRLDWMKISKVDLKGNWSARECYLVWINVCHPRINQQKWTQSEDKQLIDLARTHREKNWEKIAAELRTHRTAFLCIKRYHEKTGEKYCKRDWSEEESKELCDLAEQYRVGVYVPYNYLCYLNGTRDRNNIYNFHLKVDPTLNHGKWSASEEQAFDEALQFYNTVYNWQEISEYIGTRTSFQCKDRYELKYRNPEKYINWTPDEDRKLLEAHKIFENQWVKIARYAFPHRNDNACLHRFTKLMSWRQQNEWFQKQPDEIREFILFLCRKYRVNPNHVDVYTEDGDLVPTRPVFAQNLGNLIHRIYEKKELVYEFVRKMRQGQLSLTLLSKIGVYTHALNLIIKKYQRNHLSKMSKPLESIKKIKAKLSTTTSMKSLKKDSVRQKRTYNKDNTVQQSTEQASTSGANKKTRKRTHIRDLLAFEQAIDPTPKSLNAHIKMYQTISLNLNKKVNVAKPAKKKKSYKISELLNLNTNISNESPAAMEPASDPPSTVEKPRKERKKRAQPEPEPDQSSEPKAKRAKRTAAKSAELIKEITALKELKLTELNSKRNVQSSLVVDFNSVPDGEKIPCVCEQSSMFKFMYSLRKEANNSKYFYKYSIINWNGTYVAIKPYTGQVTQEYLNETRLKSIEQALKNVLNMLKKN